MRQFPLRDLDPASDVDDALERYAEAGWHTWAAGHGAQSTTSQVHSAPDLRVRRVGWHSAEAFLVRDATASAERAWEGSTAASRDAEWRGRARRPGGGRWRHDLE